jgi:hypothetical protein
MSEDAPEYCIRSTKYHELDADRIANLVDVKLLFKALQLSFDDKHPNFNEIKHLLKEQV